MEFTSERGTYEICLYERSNGSFALEVENLRYYDNLINCDNLEDLIELRDALNRAIECYTRN